MRHCLRLCHAVFPNLEHAFDIVSRVFGRGLVPVGVVVSLRRALGGCWAAGPEGKGGVSLARSARCLAGLVRAARRRLAPARPHLLPSPVFEAVPGFGAAPRPPEAWGVGVTPRWVD